MTAPVSRETLAQPESGQPRKYVSPYRANQGEQTRLRILAAALEYIGKGNFRPQAREIAQVAGCHKSAVTRHYGSIELLYRVLAREHWSHICAVATLPEPMIHSTEGRRIAWLIMVGAPRNE